MESSLGGRALAKGSHNALLIIFFQFFLPSRLTPPTQRAPVGLRASITRSPSGCRSVDWVLRI